MKQHNSNNNDDDDLWWGNDAFPCYKGDYDWKDP